MSSRDGEADVLGIPRLKWLAGTMMVSSLMHGAAFASLGEAGRYRDERRPPSEVSFETTPLPPEPPRIPPPPEPPPVAEPRAPIQKAAPVAPREAPPPEPVAAPLDLRGVTLTNDSGGFAMPAGNGLALDRPIGTSRAPVPTPPPPPPVAAPPAPPAAPALVAFEALGTRPSPPSLEGALARNYPADARRRAIGGSAKVRARIEPDGVARSVSVESETFGGFGEACRRTVAGSRWSPPRDSNGRAVATQVRYTCHFKVEP